MLRLSGKVLELFQCYLEQSSRRMSARGISSDVLLLLSDVPQDQVLGLTVYTRSLGIRAQRYGFKCIFFPQEFRTFVYRLLKIF